MLRLDQARTIISTGFSKAGEMKLKPMAIVVLDAGGHVVAFERQDGSPFIRFDIAQGKAWAAIAMGTSSRWFHEASETRDLRPEFHPLLRGVRWFISGLMRPAFAMPFSWRTRWA